MINAAREAVTRAMGDLEDKGTIEVVGRRIHVRDYEALEREAEARPVARSMPT